MPGVTDELCAAIEKTAELVGADYSRDQIWPTLTAYGDALDESGIVFSVQNGGHHAGELEYTMQVPKGIDDPYAHALSNKFTEETDHPVGRLLSELKEHISIDAYGVDYGVASGFKKVYALFARNPQGVAKLADIPSMPRGLAENAGFFARCGLGDVVMIGIDYQRQTVNVYFQLQEAGALDSETVATMLREIGISEPDERMLKFACTSYRVYFTLGWDSSTFQRISFAPAARRNVDLSALPGPLEPEIERFMTDAPYAYDGERIGTAAVKWTPDGPFLDFGSYYRASPMQSKAASAAR